MTKVIVVGAGISGMAAGIYALQSGFHVTLLEQHTIPGGICTSWRRKGYLFEGSMHWLTGSDEKNPINRFWQEVGALSKDSPIYYRDPFISCQYKGQTACLYRNLEKLKAHLCDISPKDTPHILRFCKDVKSFTSMNVPINNIPGLKLKKKEKAASTLRALSKMLPMLLRIGSMGKVSVGEYLRQFSHPAIRLLFSQVTNDKYSAIALFFTMACFASGDGGYLEGGSLKMARNMAKRFEELGGNIRYGVKAEKVVTDKGRASGVFADGSFITADAVIIASDTLSAIDTLFETPIGEPWAEDMRKNTKPVNCTFVGLGVEADLSHIPSTVIYPLDKPITFAGKQLNSISINNYADYEGYAPEDCTALTMILEGEYDFWKAASSDGSYKQKKQELAEQVIARLEEKIPAAKGKFVVWDIATPLTYERYCGTYHGSWMTLMPPGNKLVSYPCKPENIEGLYFAGQRLQPPGGMPVALITGRQAAQYLCRDYDVVFQGNI
ncbi:phytoene desaturase family protein [Clostridium polynesiense]|uniref:phytoene desaturase family protein n=1 Tax=Clostridium polynesiense TaxID=1325933 RepID=UPI00058F6987|nr:NAD(P)/FAD-dependent oxidoreductase [Clostridium polynesiense]